MWNAVTTLLLLTLAGGPAAPPAADSPPVWESVAPGLGYRLVEHRPYPLASPVAVHAFRFAPGDLELRVLPAGATGGHVRELAREAGALLAVNGGFFLADFTPLGLLVSQGRELNALRRVDWGVFSVARGRAAVVHRREWRAPHGLEFAIEAGPRLVVAGRVLSLKPQRARRTALCVRAPDDVAVVVTAGPLYTSELAELLARSEREGGLGCVDALNLDGGSSTQLWFDHGGRRIEVPAVAPVANAVGLFPRGSR
jgi:hypothetical protein